MKLIEKVVPFRKTLLRQKPKYDSHLHTSDLNFNVFVCFCNIQLKFCLKVSVSYYFTEIYISRKSVVNKPVELKDVLCGFLENMHYLKPKHFKPMIA